MTALMKGHCGGDIECIGHHDGVLLFAVENSWVRYPKSTLVLINLQICRATVRSLINIVNAVKRCREP